ncbi:MAG: glycosyltransferase family 4 protein [Candidatus Altiarchaeota archaeon]
MRILVYDHLLDVGGGAAKYGLWFANILKHGNSIDIVSDVSVEKELFGKRFGMYVEGLHFRELQSHVMQEKIPFLKILRASKDFASLLDLESIGFFGNSIKRIRHEVNSVRHKPLDSIVETMSGEYDLFIAHVHSHTHNHVKPNAEKSIMVCHSVNQIMQPGKREFHAGNYDTVISNSRYTKEILINVWGIDSEVVYPPVEVMRMEGLKEDAISNVGIFGTQRNQREYVRVFNQLRDNASGWKMILAGVAREQEYFKKVNGTTVNPGVEVRPNPSFEELCKVLSTSKIYWNLAGLRGGYDEVEHFGMAMAEAMKCGCVPIAINRGGPAEIITDGVDGFLVDDLEGVKSRTLELIRDENLRERMGENAAKRAADFSLEKFEKRVKDVVSSLEV